MQHFSEEGLFVYFLFVCVYAEYEATLLANEKLLDYFLSLF